MLKKRLSSSKRGRQVGAGLAPGRARAGAEVARCTGAAMRANGRIWSRTIGVPSRASGSTCAVGLVELAERRAAAPRASGPARRPSASTLTSVVLGLARARRAACATAAEMLLVLGGERLEAPRSTPARAATMSLVAGRPAPWSAGRSCGPAARGSRAAARSPCVTRARSRCSGPKRREGLAQVVAAALEALAGAGDQQLEVVARVGVERGEDLVRVDVRRGVRRPDPVALLQRLARARDRPRGTCPSGPVLVRSSAVASSLDAGPCTWARARARRPPCRPRARPCRCRRPSRRRRARSGPGPGCTAWASGSSTLSRERLLLDEREAQPLVGQDVAADAEREHEQREDREEVAEVLADRAPHSASPPSSARAPCARRLPLALAPARRAAWPVEQLARLLGATSRGRRSLVRGSRRAARDRESRRAARRVQVRRLLGLARARRAGAAAAGCRRRAAAPGRTLVGRAARAHARGSTGCCRRRGGSRPRGPTKPRWTGWCTAGRCSRGRRGRGSATWRTAPARCWCRPTARGPARAAGSCAWLSRTSAGIWRAQLARRAAQLGAAATSAAQLAR